MAELHYWRGLEVWSGSIGRSEREPMLPWRRTLLWITIFCANYLVELVQSNLCALCKVLSWITIVCAKCLLVHSPTSCTSVCYEHLLQIYCIIGSEEWDPAGLAAPSHPTRHSGIRHTRSSVMPAPGLGHPDPRHLGPATTSGHGSHQAQITL